MAIKMPATKEIIVGVTLLIIFAVAMVLVLNVYKTEGEKRSADISEAGEKNPNHLKVYVKLLGVDPTKGDVSARLEFEPQGTLAKDETGALTRPLKLFVNSATGKQEHDFTKDKRMNPVDVTVSLYDGLVTDYPFDKHKAYLEMYFTQGSSTDKSSADKGSADKSAGADKGAGASTSNTPTTASTEGAAGAAPSPSPGATGQEGAGTAAANKEAEDGDDDNDIPISVDFFGSIPGMSIQAEKSKESTDDYVGIEMEISRSSTVRFFSLFIMFLMWGAAIAVLLLVLSILLRGRKIEVGMFSFLSALIFAMVAVRNSQPGVPPIGTYSDFISFFWAEVILALCLMTILFTWLTRPAGK